MKPRKPRRDWNRDDYFWQRIKGNVIAGAIIAAVVLVALGVKELIERL